MTNARWDRIAVSRRFADAMNARVCEVIAACAGNKTSLQDFLILPAEKEKTKSNVPEMGDTPEEIEMKLKLLTGSLRAGGYE